MKIRIIQLFCLFVFWINVQTSAQIGYQVSLLNSATGEPRVHATVNAQVTLTNSLDEIILTENKSVTSNDFGVLSFTIGDENTLKDVDWNKLPFHISVKVDGVLIGKIQVLSVPVAEYAKQSGAVITKEMLMGKKWISRTSVDGIGTYDLQSSWTFTEDKYIYFNGKNEEQGYIYEEHGYYEVLDGKIYCFANDIHYTYDDGEMEHLSGDKYSTTVLEYLPSKNVLILEDEVYYAE